MSRNESNSAAMACNAHADRSDALLEILHDVQTKDGCISDEAVLTIAHQLNLSRAEVHGVRSFYSDFTETSGAKSTVKLCRGEACQAVGCDDLAQTLEHNKIKTETVYCLGNCALGPAALIDTQLVGRADLDRITSVIEAQDE